MIMATSANLAPDVWGHGITVQNTSTGMAIAGQLGPGTGAPPPAPAHTMTDAMKLLGDRWTNTLTYEQRGLWLNWYNFSHGCWPPGSAVWTGWSAYYAWNAAAAAFGGDIADEPPAIVDWDGRPQIYTPSVDEGTQVLQVKLRQIAGALPATTRVDFHQVHPNRTDAVDPFQHTTHAGHLHPSHNSTTPWHYVTVQYLPVPHYVTAGSGAVFFIRSRHAIQASDTAELAFDLDALWYVPVV